MVVAVESAIELVEGWGSVRTSGIIFVDSAADAKVENIQYQW